MHIRRLVYYGHPGREPAKAFGMPLCRHLVTHDARREEQPVRSSSALERASERESESTRQHETA